ncbi:MAG: rhomboid family intramembrane serine protease [Nanoarchaeota archaeon]|nr:rhomboid family intramembrane serine protease [Nanoarchaeota archaeon]
MKQIKFYSIWLSLICIIVFIIQSIIPGFTELFLLNSSKSFEIWRFVTSIFLHGSSIHLVYNLFALLLFGLILESLISSRKFLIVFFLTGIFANLISVFFYEKSLGASGAIFGIIGTLTILKPLMTVWAFSLPMPLFVASIIWLIGDVLGVFIPSNTANLAHLSGLAIGLIIGVLIRTKKQIQEHKTYTRNIKIPEPDIRGWEDEFMR